MTSAISCPLWPSVYECQRVECVLTSLVRTECGMFVMCCMQCCMSLSTILVLGCAVSSRYINVCNSDVFNVVNVYHDHLKLCVGCINGRRYVCCSECHVVSDECDQPTPCVVQPDGEQGGEVIYFWSVCIRDELGFLNCYDICMSVVTKQ